MTDRDALLSAVLEHPADDTARLVLADFLRERSDPSDVALGRFLWAGVTASRYRDADVIEEAEYYAALAELTAVTAESWPAQWIAAVCLGPSLLNTSDWGWDSTADRVTVRVGPTRGEFERGMLTGLTVTILLWSMTARDILAAWPVERVSISASGGLTYRIEPPAVDRGWRLLLERRAPARRVPLEGGAVAALSPVPVPVEPAAGRAVERSFPDRAALVAQVAEASRELLVAVAREAG